MQAIARAFSRACANTGKRMAARIAMMAMTTSSSIRVKAEEFFPLARLQTIMYTLQKKKKSHRMRLPWELCYEVYALSLRLWFSFLSRLEKMGLLPHYPSNR